MFRIAALLAATALATVTFAQDRPETPEDIVAGKVDDLMERCPDFTRDEAEAIINPPRTAYGESYHYAQAYCVSPQEGGRRMALQEEWSIGPTAEVISDLLTRIQRAEPTFAGSWIQHEPDYRFAIGFTEDAEATLAKYTSDPMFVAIERPGAATDAIERDSQTFLTRLGGLGIDFASAGYDVMEGVFRIQLRTETTAAVDALVADGELSVPDWVKFETARPFPHARPRAAVDPGRLKAFPKLRERTDMLASTLVGVSDRRAELIMDNGCIRVVLDDDPEAIPLTVLWQKQHAPDLSSPDSISVLDRLRGNRVEVGRRVVLSGLQPGTERSYQALNTKPEQLAEIAEDTGGVCPGPYRYVESMTDEAEYDAARREEKVLRWIEHGRLDRNAAEARVDADAALVERFGLLREGLLRDHADIVADFWFDTDMGPIPWGRPDPIRAQLYVKEGAAAGDVIPRDLERYIRVHYVPRSRLELDALENSFAYLGDGVEVRAEPYDGTVMIHAPGDVSTVAEALRSGRLELSDNVQLHLGQTGPETTGDPKTGWFAVQDAIKTWRGYRDLEAYVREWLMASPMAGRVSVHEVERLAKELITHGFEDVGELRDAESRGTGPLTAHHSYDNSLDWQVRNILKTGQAVTARLETIDTEDAGPDGHRSTLTFRILDRVHGNLEAGERITVRFVGGMDGDDRAVVGANEAPLFAGLPDALETGRDYLLLPNRALYRYAALQASGATHDPGPLSHYALKEVPILIEGDRIVREHGITTVSGLKTLLAAALEG